MLHPMLIPILIIPHFAIPAGLMYLIYLDNNETIARVRSAQKHARVRRQNNSKLAKFIKANPPMGKLCPVSMLIDSTSASTSAFNVNSPMLQFAKQNKGALYQASAYHDFYYYVQRIRKTPMSDLVNTLQFKLELQDAVYHNNLSHYYKSYFKYNVVPRIAVQHGVVTSKLAIFTRASLWYPIIHQIYIDSLREEKQDSPMRKLARTEEFQEHLYDISMFRSYDQFLQERSPMHKLATLEYDNIILRARKCHMSNMMGPSRMHQFAMDKGNAMMITYLSSGITYRNARRTSSPMRMWTKIHKQTLLNASYQMRYIRNLRKQVLYTIGQLLNKNYGHLYRKFMLRDFRKTNGIPEVAFQPDCANYAIIEFPQDVQVVNRFLADSNLDGFTNHTIYYDRNHYQSFATSLLVPQSGKPSINDITDAAQTFKNIASLTEYETTVSILSDSTKITGVKNNEKVKHHTDIYFVKRDRKAFTRGDYRSCSSKIYSFLSRYPDIKCRIGFSERWLSDTMVVTLIGPENGDTKYINFNADLIQMVNLVKGVIFQKVVDRACWLCLK